MKDERPGDDDSHESVTPDPGASAPAGGASPGRKAKWKILGPGLLVAATGIGAGDLVATLVAGSRFGYALLWAAIAGSVIKVFLVEGAGRWSLATGHSIFEGWRRLGSWTSVYFGLYILVWGFVYGATAMSASALPIYAVFPQIPFIVYAIFSGLVGLVLVWLGRYHALEKIVAVFVGLMFVTVVGSAAFAAPNVLDAVTGLVPLVPDGGLVYTLSIIGGVGGTITLAAYGYWLKEKGWYSPAWMRVMRIDNSFAYLISGIFVVSMLIIGAELLHSANIAIQSGDEGLVELSGVLDDQYGPFVGKLFLIGFWAASFSSILGAWNGVSIMFADFWGRMWKKPEDHPARRSGGKYYKFYVLWLTLPPMLLLLIGKPVGIIIAYGVLGSFFMPFLSITLLFLLNGRHMPEEWRNGWVLNLVLGVITLLFVVLGLNELIGVFQ